jgi:hypothetical protein
MGREVNARGAVDQLLKPAELLFRDRLERRSGIRMIVDHCISPA